MKNKIFAVILFMLASCSQANYVATLSESKNYSTNNYAENLSMTYKRRLFFVELIVNGKKANFLIDTGASVSLLDINQAKSYDFKYMESEESSVVNGLNGSVKQFVARNVIITSTDDKIFLSRFRTCDLSYIVEKFNEDGIYILGVIGSDILKQTNAVIDYKEMKLSLNMKF